MKKNIKCLNVVVMTIMLAILSTLDCRAEQVIYDENNKHVLCRIDDNGIVYDRFTRRVGRFEQDGTIRDGYDVVRGKIDAENTIRDEKGRYIGCILKNGTVRNGLNSYVGKISKKGVVTDCADRIMGIAKDVDRRIVAVWFFSDMLKR